MSTTPATPTPQQPAIVSLLELFANITLTAIPVTVAFMPLISAFEAGISPLVASVAAGSTKTADVLAGFAASISVINTLKAQTGLAPDVIAKLDEYAVAAQNGITAAIAAGKTGYDPTQLQPVPLIP